MTGQVVHTRSSVTKQQAVKVLISDSAGH